MATQLATLFLRRLEVPVVLRDLDAGDRRPRARGSASELAVQVAEADSTRARRASSARSSTGSTGYDVFAGCDLVLEAVFEELAVKQEVFAELERVVDARVRARDEHVVALGDGDGRRPRAPGAARRHALLQPGRGAPARRAGAHAGDGRRDARDGVGRHGSGCASAACSSRDAPAFVVNRVLTRMTTVLMDALEHGNTVEETDEAVLRLGLPMAPSVLLQMVGPRVANHVLETLHDAYPDRFRFAETLRRFADGGEEIVVAGDRPVPVEAITTAVLEALADEVRHLLEEGVVDEAADVDTCLLLGAGWPFFLGGITKHLDQTGVSQRVVGRRLAEVRAAAPV